MVLVQNIAQVAATDGPGWTLLQLAAFCGYCGVKALLGVESDWMETQNPYGETALRIVPDTMARHTL